jgi:rod shape-determining protein MreD
MSNSIYLAIPLMALLSILQSAVLPHFPIIGLTPQLLFLVALAWGMQRGFNEGIVWAFIAGFFSDLFSLAPLGVSSLIFVVVTALTLLLQQLLPPSHLILPMLLATAATLVYLFLYALVLRVLGPGLALDTLLSLLPLSLLHGFFIVPLYWIMGQALRVVRPARVEI